MSHRHGPIAITGPGGRLGRALLAAAPGEAQAWGRDQLDLDDPGSFEALLERTRPRLVIHPAAMTDVDACARDPELALRRNGVAAGALARACRTVDAGLLLVSTNEVFDGERSDGRGYTERDQPDPRNPYGASKLAGEIAVAEVFDGAKGLWVVRTAWLFGPPGNDFPQKIVAAADRLPVDEALAVVDDEYGSPTSVVDLARAIFEVLEHSAGGTFHLVNEGAVSRLEVATRVLAVKRPGRTIRAISREAFDRLSDPPRWGVLDASRAASATGRPLRPWQPALDDYLTEW